MPENISPSSSSRAFPSRYASALPPISEEALAFLRKTDPTLVALVDRAARRSQRRRGVRLPLSRFGEDFLRLYTAAWYAVSHGVTFTLVPEPPEPS